MIAIIKYNAGNIRSVQNAVTRLGYESIITDEIHEIQNASKVIFPGVGEASSAMAYLREKGLDMLLVSLQQPVLGICLGLQLMCASSEEGETQCLGVFDAVTKQFPPLKKVPHMGWNNFSKLEDVPMLKGISLSDDFYYVHSYYATTGDATIATCNYITEFSAVMQKDNFYAMQFHPEKSADIGEKLLQNFLEI